MRSDTKPIKNRSVAFIYTSSGHGAGLGEADHGHPAHRGFQTFVNADKIMLSPGPQNFPELFRHIIAGYRTKIPDYDIFVFENFASLLSAPFIQRTHSNSTLVYLADTGVFGTSAYNLSTPGVLRGRIGYLEHMLKHKSIIKIANNIDGLLSISNHVDSFLSDRVSVPSRVVYPYVQPDVERELKKITPDYSSSHAVYLGGGEDYKGVDILASAWEKYNSGHQDAVLHIIGNGHSNNYAHLDSVVCHGFVNDLSTILSKVSIAIHPARQDAFPVSTLETMMAGLVPIVTNTTGTKKIVYNISDVLVSESKKTELVKTITEVYKTPHIQRKTWGYQARQLALGYTKSNAKKKFRESFSSLIKEIKT